MSYTKPLALLALMMISGFAFPLSNILIKNGFYVDVGGRKSIPFSRMVVEEGIITAIEKGDKAASLIDESMFTAIDLGGGYLAPGLIDAFSHALPSEPAFLSRSGMTTTMVLGGRNPGPGRVPGVYAYFHFSTLPKEKQWGDIFYSGPLIVGKEDGPTSFLSKKIREQHATTSIADQKDWAALMWEWEEKLPSMVFLKTVKPVESVKTNGGGDDFITDIVAEIRRRGITWVAYAEKSGDALYASDQGAKVVVMHMGEGMVAEELKELARRNVYLITSTTLYESYGKAFRREEEGTTLGEEARRNLKIFIAAGGKVLIGSFYGNPFVLAGPPLAEIRVHRDIYRELGKDPGEILENLTLTPIQAFSPEDDFESNRGGIQVGAPADLIVVRENPLENLDTLGDIRAVIHDGHLIRDEENLETQVEVDVAYIKYFTRKDFLRGTLVPLLDSYPQTLHLTLAPIFGGVVMEDGLGRFEFGLFSRLLIPSSWEYHQLEVGLSAVFYDPVLFHLTLDYLHFFTPRWGLGVSSSVLPDSHYLVGSHIQFQQLPYSFSGERQWFSLDVFLNFEDYVVERSRWFAIRTKSHFDFYDYLPPWFSSLNFSLGLDGAVDWENHRKSLGQSLVFTIGLSVWENVFWEKQILGDTIPRFLIRKGNGYLKTQNIIGVARAYDETISGEAIIGWLSKVEVSFLTFSIFEFKGGIFWEMQKLGDRFADLFQWDDRWVMDFGPNLILAVGGFRLEIGMYVPVTPRGSVLIPGFYGGFRFF